LLGPGQGIRQACFGGLLEGTAKGGKCGLNPQGVLAGSGFDSSALRARRKMMDLGMSKYPVCGKEWLVTPFQDCMLPACGCYGDDVSEKNPSRPCERCGFHHAVTCPKMGFSKEEQDNLLNTPMITVKEKDVIKDEDGNPIGISPDADIDSGEEFPN
jgi:hypothetical protein